MHPIPLENLLAVGVVCVAIAGISYKRNLLDRAGLVAAVATGLIIGVLGDPVWLFVLLVYLVSSFAATRYRFEKKKELKSLSYGSPRELLAAKFHMDQGLLARLNPKASFETAGSKIMVANVARKPSQAKVAKVVVNKSQSTVRALDGDGKLVAFLHPKSTYGVLTEFCMPKPN